LVRSIQSNNWHCLIIHHEVEDGSGIIRLVILYS
jgi:hypothetical protein